MPAEQGSQETRRRPQARGWRPRRQTRRPSAPAATPYQAGIVIRACDQEKTHGIARRSSIRRLLEYASAGRLPIFSCVTSLAGVADQKKASKAGSS